MPERQRLQLLGQHLATAPGLRMEFSLQLCGTRLRCPVALQQYQREHSPRALYQGLALDLGSDAAPVSLFLHCRDRHGEQRLGCRWDGQQLQHSEYRTGTLHSARRRDWLQQQVPPDHQPLLARLLQAPRLIRRGGYWLQYQHGQLQEIYLTYPWHPLLHSLAPALAACLPPTAPALWQAYQHAPIRHLGFSSQCQPAPALTLYVGARHYGRWPQTLAELEQGVIASATASRAALARQVGD